MYNKSNIIAMHYPFDWYYTIRIQYIQNILTIIWQNPIRNLNFAPEVFSAAVDYYSALFQSGEIPTMKLQAGFDFLLFHLFQLDPKD